jgi:hypothetical protein
MYPGIYLYLLHPNLLPPLLSSLLECPSLVVPNPPRSKTIKVNVEVIQLVLQ